jgi:hypothetical protein
MESMKDTRIESSATHNGDGTTTITVTAYVPSWLEAARVLAVQEAAVSGRLIVLKDGDDVCGYFLAT